MSPNKTKTNSVLPVVLTIAGSDSGGGAGIQADLKAFHAMKTFGTTAITAVTAQNPMGVSSIHPVDPVVVASQIAMVSRAFPLAAAKTGMLYSRSIIHAVTLTLKRFRPPILVVDPVMIATSGARLLSDDATTTLLAELIPMATVVTPNIPEAEVITGRRIRSTEQMLNAAKEISEKFKIACVLKGGHLAGDVIQNVLAYDGKQVILKSKRIIARSTHGTGCTFSAVLTASLAHGHSLPQAFKDAQEMVYKAMLQSRRLGRHYVLAI